MNLEPGKYKGKIMGCVLDVIGEKKTPCIKITFDVNGEEVEWTGWFSPKLNERTGKTYAQLVMDTVLKLGYQGRNIQEVSVIPVDELFHTQKEFSVTIGYQTKKDGTDSAFLEIKYINFYQGAEIEVVMASFKGFEAEFLRAKAEFGRKEEPKNEIPF